MKFINVVILSLSSFISISQPKLALAGCNDPCNGPLECIGNYNPGSTSGSCTFCYVAQSRTCIAPMCGDPCTDSNSQPVDDICKGASDGCTSCRWDDNSGTYICQPPQPMAAPSGKPSVFPSGKPSVFPSGKPSVSPSGKPSASGKPSFSPSTLPSLSPSGMPSASGKPSVSPSTLPSLSPSKGKKKTKKTKKGTKKAKMPKVPKKARKAKK